MSGKWGNYYTVDPHEMSCRFSSDEGLSSIDQICSVMSIDSSEKMDRIKSIIGKLPPIEEDFVNLYYFKRVKQTAIAKIFRVSQPTVCYRLQRATIRIKFLLDMPDIPLFEIRDAIVPILDDKLDVNVMILMAYTTCQSETAKRLGVSQGMVRHRFFRSLKKMRDLGMHKYVNFFDIISKNLNKMREVSVSDSMDLVNRIVD